MVGTSQATRLFTKTQRRITKAIGALAGLSPEEHLGIIVSTWRLGSGLSVELSEFARDHSSAITLNIPFGYIEDLKKAAWGGSSQKTQTHRCRFLLHHPAVGRIRLTGCGDSG